MKKILAITAMIFIAVFYSHAQEDPWELVDELTTELEASTELIEQLRAENERLTQENEQLKNALQSSGNELIEANEQLRAENERLTQENISLTNQLEETTDELQASTDLIIELRDELVHCQTELDYFREEYRKCVVNDVDQNFGIGLGMAYPIGTEAIATFKLPFLQIVEVYGRVGFNDTTFISGGGGVIINF